MGKDLRNWGVAGSPFVHLTKLPKPALVVHRSVPIAVADLADSSPPGETFLFLSCALLPDRNGLSQLRPDAGTVGNSTSCSERDQSWSPLDVSGLDLRCVGILVWACNSNTIPQR